METSSCWQYRIKQEHAVANHFHLPDAVSSCPRIVELSYATAKDFILRYEWLGNMGTSKYCYGLLFNEEIASVVCFGPTVAPSKYSRILGLDHSSKILQLCRGATAYWAPKYASSKLISRSMRLLHKSLGTIAVFAYSDPAAGEIGTVYQASNAYYLGTTSVGGAKRYIIDGHSYDPRKVHKKFGSRARTHLLTIDPDYKTETIGKKHRYLFLLCKGNDRIDCVKRIARHLQPYPKRPP